MAAYRLGMTLKVTCGLTACTPGSASGPTFGNKYGVTLPFTFDLSVIHHVSCSMMQLLISSHFID